jgi:ATP-dependent helicase Lhr and Lhr-like helicase
LANVGNLARQKWDGLLSPRLLRISYASLNLDLGEAMEWLVGHARNDHGLCARDI